jgi:uncharacterized protein
MGRIDYAHEAATIVRDAGGRIVGRTKLQKIGYFLEVAGLGGGLSYQYKHYGPYSEQLALGAHHAAALRLISENEMLSSWGGTYSTFTSSEPQNATVDPARTRLAHELASTDAIELELAATALFLRCDGFTDPWGETERRKPEKAGGGRLERAKQLYRRVCQIRTPQPFPAL